MYMATIKAVSGVFPSSARTAANNGGPTDTGGRSSSSWSSSVGSPRVIGAGSASLSKYKNKNTDFQDYLDQYIAMVKSNTAANNAFNAEQAQLNRDWQERMSNTAHQREVKDLQAAGLNPVLSAMNGNGASTTSGATASADTSGNSAIAGILGSVLNSFVSLENQRLSAQTNLAVADKYNAMTKYTSELNAATNLEMNKRSVNAQIAMGKLSAQTALSTANISATTQRYVAQLQSSTSLSVAQINKAATIVSAQLHSAATRYAADKSYQSSQYSANVHYLTQSEVTRINGEINKELKKMGIDAEFDYAEAYPSNAYQYDAGQANVRDWIDTIAGGFRDLGIGASGFGDLLPGLTSGKSIGSSFKFGPFGSGF